MQVKFVYETKYGMFSDALNLPDDHSLTEAEIQQMKEQRRDAWIAHIDSTQIETPPVEEAPSETPPVEDPPIEEPPAEV